MLQQQQHAGSAISLQTFADLLNASTVTATLDIGSALIHHITHPEQGRMALVNTAHGGCAVFAVAGAAA